MGEHHFPRPSRITRPDFFNAILRYMNKESAPEGLEEFDKDVAKLITDGMAGDYESQQIIAEAIHYMKRDGWPI